ncbi:ribokinase, partial [Salmonella enterica subsp. enterica serovar Kentucky]|nr:ribokinase [Salmonella enterica subsp. enterica serovar Kentucky]
MWYTSCSTIYRSDIFIVFYYIISYLPRLPSTGESLLADKFIFSPGGKGCNQALAASYADSDV